MLTQSWIVSDLVSFFVHEVRKSKKRPHEKIVYGLISIGFLFSASTHALTLKECNEVASELNKLLPHRIDATSTAVSSVCLGKNPMYLQYSISLDAAKSNFSAKQLQSHRSKQLNSWCSSPRLAKLLQLVAVRYIYSDKDGLYVGQTSFSAKECPTKTTSFNDSEYTQIKDTLEKFGFDGSTKSINRFSNSSIYSRFSDQQKVSFFQRYVMSDYHYISANDATKNAIQIKYGVQDLIR